MSGGAAMEAAEAEADRGAPPGGVGRHPKGFCGHLALLLDTGYQLRRRQKGEMAGPRLA
ncbi:hypothetical protein [Sphingomonas oligoaromativorans]|uniref:hypothetical protein n=1 Tax=Sphingomonas oligoaromativorans TaxID=575322 RepID=UPI001421FD15|nr:hypothetical protein [Sphingomonas oligoaromativorans]NIJ35118.1 hypothetical protein [Sphingomonas oligoaromativorans]